MFYYYFQKWVGGGGGVKVCYLRHYMKKYRAIRLLVFSVKTLNVIRCARYVYVGGGGREGREDGRKKCLCSIPSILYTRNRIRDRINPDGYHQRSRKKHEDEHSTPYSHLLYTEWLTK